MTTLADSAVATGAAPSPLRPATGPRPLSLTEYSIDPDGYWGRFQDLNGATIIDHCYEWLERDGTIDNFRLAAAGPQAVVAGRRGREFADSDVYKLLEAMIWEQARRPSQAREQRIRDLIGVVAAAQEPDGYLNTKHGRPGQAARYSNLSEGHELYCYGHLFQAAVARLRCDGHDQLADVALRAADHVCRRFGPGTADDGLCGHPEIELGLIELARATGIGRYRDQAALFVERRGYGRLKPFFDSVYFQDDMPVRQATVARGHAVRAVYLAAAATDLAIDTADAALLAALNLQWANTVSARTYITGGMGSRREDEAFGEDFELPPDVAYSETCAGVGAIMWSWRMALATGQSYFVDLVERILFNVVATSPAASGKAFFYSNPLAVRVPGTPPSPDEMSLRAVCTMRSPWFDVSCCPPNVARLLASLASYTGWVDGRTVTLAQYASGSLAARLPDGDKAQAAITTRYPDDGRVAIMVGTSAADPWTLRLRVPHWATKATLSVNGAPAAPVQPGWAEVPGLGAGPTEIVLDLGVEPRFTYGDPRIDSARGAVAVERGPVVYCLESTDIDGSPFHAVVDVAAGLTDTDQGVAAHGLIAVPPGIDWPYQPTPEAAPGVETELRLVPYNTWGEKGPSTMTVWLRSL
ncbi:MAG: glycoside hydrolase family 127 protein [Bifidobacteriaceae bacterium]|jgi:DUF1680 family protein|nr:glycoside hydrolase family 127 protein [Bifidobacteriaceae bacterium]